MNLKDKLSNQCVVNPLNAMAQFQYSLYQHSKPYDRVRSRLLNYLWNNFFITTSMAMEVEMKKSLKNSV